MQEVQVERRAALAQRGRRNAIVGDWRHLETAVSRERLGLPSTVGSGKSRNVVVEIWQKMSSSRSRLSLRFCFARAEMVDGPAAPRFWSSCALIARS